MQAKDTPDAPAAADKELAKLGPMSVNEKITAFAFAITVALWIFGGSIGVNAVAAATVGLFIMLVTNVVTWKQCLDNNAAWDTLTWFAALIAMAASLNKYGFIPWLSNSVVQVRERERERGAARGPKREEDGGRGMRDECAWLSMHACMLGHGAAPCGCLCPCLCPRARPGLDGIRASSALCRSGTARGWLAP